MKSTAFLATLAVLALVSCSEASDSKNKSEAASTAPSAPKTEGGEAGEAAAGASAKVAIKAETKTYVAEIQPPEKVTAGSPIPVKVVVRPKGEWHFNLEFPTSLKIEVTGAEVDRPKQTLADAKKKTEADGAIWEINVTPAAGANAVNCNLKFAVCTDTTCVPKKASLAWKVDVAAE